MKWEGTALPHGGLDIQAVISQNLHLVGKPLGPLFSFDKMKIKKELMKSKILSRARIALE
jgi:hypothetical protein